MGAEYSMSRCAAVDIEGKRIVITGGTAGMAGYIASKAALDALVRTAAGDMRR